MNSNSILRLESIQQYLIYLQLLNLNVAFQYVGNFDAETISLICLSILLIILLTWFLFENLWLDSYVRYTLSQYPGQFLCNCCMKNSKIHSFFTLTYSVVIFATGGILSKQADVNRRDGPVPESVHIFTWVILGIAIIQIIARVSIVIYRYRTQPLHTNPDRTTIQPKATQISIKNDM